MVYIKPINRCVVYRTDVIFYLSDIRGVRLGQLDVNNNTKVQLYNEFNVIFVRKNQPPNPHFFLVLFFPQK